EVARRIITAPVRSVGRGPGNRFVVNTGTNPEDGQLLGFYQAAEGRAENAGAAVSRLFVGVKLECAQCHDHPFAPYTRQQFWEFAAFFADMNPLAAPRPGFVGPLQPQAERNRLTIPGSKNKGEQKVVARFFDGSDP